MSSNISIPLFLQPGKAQDLNSQLINNNKSFSFLGEPAELINKTPSTYAEAFDQYISALYVLYHDHGMFFLRSYTNQSIETSNYSGYESHIRFVFNSRHAIQHSDDYETRDKAYKTLKNYFFRDDTSFTFSDWHEFWVKADDEHWKKLVNKLVMDSDKFYNYYMKKIAEHAPQLQSIYEKISEIFRIGEYFDTYGKCIKMYDNSFDDRFLKIIRNKLKNSFMWEDPGKAKQELNKLKGLKHKKESDSEKVSDSENEVMYSAINEMKKFLLSGECQKTEHLFQYLCQTIFDQIQCKIETEKNIETDDMLD